MHNYNRGNKIHNYNRNNKIRNYSRNNKIRNYSRTNKISNYNRKNMSDALVIWFGELVWVSEATRYIIITNAIRYIIVAEAIRYIIITNAIRCVIKSLLIKPLPTHRFVLHIKLETKFGTLIDITSTAYLLCLEKSHMNSNKLEKQNEKQICIKWLHIFRCTGNLIQWIGLSVPSFLLEDILL